MLAVFLVFVCVCVCVCVCVRVCVRGLRSPRCLDLDFAFEYRLSSFLNRYAMRYVRRQQIWITLHHRRHYLLLPLPLLPLPLPLLPPLLPPPLPPLPLPLPLPPPLPPLLPLPLPLPLRLCLPLLIPGGNLLPLSFLSLLLSPLMPLPVTLRWMAVTMVI